MGIPLIDYLDRPYSDVGSNANMEYDYNEQRYVPLVDGIKQNAYVNLIIDWKTPENAQSYLDLLSRVVYETILSYKDAKYKVQMLYYLSHSKKARIELFKIFCDSAWYNRRDGGFMMAYNSGANLNQGKLIEFGIDKALSPIAHQIVKNSYLGARYMPIDINTIEIFDDLESLKTHLVSEGYITEAQALEVEELEDLPFDRTYRVFLNAESKYVFTDLRTLKKAVAKMKIYNTNGTW